MVKGKVQGFYILGIKLYIRDNGRITREMEKENHIILMEKFVMMEILLFVSA